MVIIVIEDTDFKNNHFRNSENVISSLPSTQELTRILENLEGKEEKVVITWASTSFLDYSLVDKMFSVGDYDIVFIPNLPNYMEFEIWNVSFLLEKLKTLPSIKKPLRESMGSLELDESLFFIDVYQPDIRLYRFDLTPDTYKSKRAVEYMYGHIDFSRELAQQIVELVKADPKILVEIPTFYMFEVSSKSAEDLPIKRTWASRFEKATFDVFLKVFEQARKLSKEFTFVLGVYNEPLFNEEIEKVMDFISTEDLKGVTFIFSTSLPWVNETLLRVYEKTKGMVGYRGYGRFYVFVTLPRVGSKRFEDVVSKVSMFKNIDPERIYVRFVRDKESVKYLPELYSRMKEYNIIVSRTFDKEFVDADTIFPVRFPCYKLQTSLIILPNGDVPLCLNDFNLANKLGNILEEDISTVVLRKVNYYKDHFFGNYEGICKDCIIWDQYDL